MSENGLIESNLKSEVGFVFGSAKATRYDGSARSLGIADRRSLGSKITGWIILHKGTIVANDSVENLRNLMKLPSLEEIFSQLVEHEDTDAMAREIVEVMKHTS